MRQYNMCEAVNKMWRNFRPQNQSSVETVIVACQEKWSKSFHLYLNRTSDQWQMIDNYLVAMTHDESSPQDVSRNFAIPAASDNLIAPCIWFQHNDKNKSANIDCFQLSFIWSACKQTKLYPSNVIGLSPSWNDTPPLHFLLTKGRLKSIHFTKSDTLRELSCRVFWCKKMKVPV